MYIDADSMKVGSTCICTELAMQVKEFFYSSYNRRRSSSVIFRATAGQKRLKNEIAENFKKKIGKLGCEEARI